MKKKAAGESGREREGERERERERFRPLAEGGQAGRGHSWSLPEVKGVLKWAKTVLSIICSYPL